MADDAQTVTQDSFQVYQDRLHALIGREAETLSLLTNMVQISLLLGTHRSWAVLFLKKSCDTLKHTPVETGAIWKPITLEFDLFGQIFAKPESDSQSERHGDMERSVLKPCVATNIQ